MRRAVFPGSFDPVTVGHMDLIVRSADIFDELILAVLVNERKSPLFTPEERVEILRELTAGMPGVSVEAFGGLLVDFMEKKQADVIVRGLRTAQDFSYEFPMAQANRKLCGRIDTVFLASSPEFSYISSSGVKEIEHFGGSMEGMVPDLVIERLQEKKRYKSSQMGGTYGQ